MTSTVHTIDAKGRTLGRVASEAAFTLLGKGRAATARKNIIAPVAVRITNAGAIAIPEKKLTQKTYHRHSGYPGSDRAVMLKEVIEKKGKSEALREAVKGMLPGNKLRDKRLKNLTIEE